MKRLWLIGGSSPLGMTLSQKLSESFSITQFCRSKIESPEYSFVKIDLQNSVEAKDILINE